MKILRPVVATFLLISIGASQTPAAAATPADWREGRNYYLIEPAHPTSLPRGKVEVTEVFSYACPACNQFLPTMHRLIQSLPANAVVDYLPASFNSSEDWPMFQQAYCTAQTLGVAAQTHDAMFAAVWETGELAIVDPATGRLKDHMPSIEDAARFYNRHAGVPVEKFLATAFGAGRQAQRDDKLIEGYRVDRTPTIVVNGKYRLFVESAGGTNELIELVNWLVAKESN